VRAIAAASPAVGQNAALVAFLNSLSADPLLQAIPLQAFDPIANTRSTFVASEFADIPGIEESTIDNWEIGYKGLLGGKLLIAADAWWAKHKNFTSPLITITPLILMDPLQLKAYLDPRVLVAVGGNAALRDQIVGGLISLPAGVVSAPVAQGAVPDVLVSYVNYGEMNLNGFDLSATALLSSKWQLGVSGSLVNKDHVEIPLRGDIQFVALNAPKKKATGHLTYRDLASGLNGEVRVRYTDEFPANSAGYVGLECVTNDPATGPCVQDYTLLDLTAGYRLPISGASLQFSIQNLLDEDYQSFVGTPVIGRMAILRLRYDL
jgi:outer membrane receptor protein involved in Fe transport